jgi:hypothetical protein
VLKALYELSTAGNWSYGLLLNHQRFEQVILFFHPHQNLRPVTAMKLGTSILLALGAIGSAAILRPRQNWPDGFLNYVPMIEKVAPPMKPSKVVTVQARIRAHATRKQFRFGPFYLPAGKVGLARVHLL